MTSLVNFWPVLAGIASLTGLAIAAPNLSTRKSLVGRASLPIAALVVILSSLSIAVLLKQIWGDGNLFAWFLAATASLIALNALFLIVYENIVQTDTGGAPNNAIAHCSILIYSAYTSHAVVTMTAGAQSEGQLSSIVLVFPMIYGFCFGAFMLMKSAMYRY